MVPVGAKRQFKVLRERPGEDLWIVDGDLVRELVPFTLQVLDGVKRIAVPAGFCRVRVVIVIQDPPLEVDGIDNQGVAFPFPDRVTII